MGRFETEILTHPENQTTLMSLSGKWIDRLRQRTPMKRIVLDMDSSVSETYGRQEGTAHDDHLGCTSYHPSFCFNHFGDLEGWLDPEQVGRLVGRHAAGHVPVEQQAFEVLHAEHYRP